MASMIPIIHSNWHHFFDSFSFSSDDLYTRIEIIMKENDYPGVTIKRVKFYQGSGFFVQREYLRITRHELMFDICAAPFGKGFFVSWWFGERVSWFDIIIAHNRLLYVLFGTRKTYYQLDVESMFQEGVRKSVLKALDEISSQKGLRALSENERQYQMRPNKFSKIQNA